MPLPNLASATHHVHALEPDYLADCLASVMAGLIILVLSIFGLHDGTVLAL